MLLEQRIYVILIRGEAKMKEVLAVARLLMKMVTITSELPVRMEMIEFLKERAILVVLAHSNAILIRRKKHLTKEQVMLLLALTECVQFNTVTSDLLSLLLKSHVSLQAIVDHVHLHQAIVRLMYRSKRPEEVVLKQRSF